MELATFTTSEPVNLQSGLSIDAAWDRTWYPQMTGTYIGQHGPVSTILPRNGNAWACDGSTYDLVQNTQNMRANWRERMASPA